ncbi:MAG TPA: biotin carboxylase N-terminal domain-containing protein [Bacteroidales bacterium]|nr:biotin carboxylase N-terminal domain-containing protein [Bacteroidales bacterium]
MKTNTIHKILVANRSEIAARVISAVKNSGKAAVAIYAESDKNMPYVSMADEAWSLGDAGISETYLNTEKIIEIARLTGADAVHPGYGFLSENASFAKKCIDNNLIFIGPTPEAIDLMGNKANARQTAEKLGVPVIKGITGSPDEILEARESLQFPLLIKPAAGGGGKGMQIVRKKESLPEKLQDASREAMNYFGSDELYVEHYIENARHIEVQILGDHHGNLVHLFERECTLQRRYQKIIEEAPSITISKDTRQALTSSALKLAEGIKYYNAGTVEFLTDENERFYFIEMNTRIQVEHPVSEQITGIDIVSEQIRIAENKKLLFSQNDIQINGHAIEARVYAENPESEFMPSTGKIHTSDTSRLNERADIGYITGNVVSPYYDPMLSKVIAHGSDRSEATEKLTTALKNYHISGIQTNKPFLLEILSSDKFANNNISTKYIDDSLNQIIENIKAKNSEEIMEVIQVLSIVIALNYEYNSDKYPSIWQELGHWRQDPTLRLNHEGKSVNVDYDIITRKKAFKIFINGTTKSAEILAHTNGHYRIQIDNKQYSCWADIDCSEIWIDYQHINTMIRRVDIPDEKYSYSANNTNEQSNAQEIIAPLNGKLVKINVKENQKIRKGDILLVIESMKMENKIISQREATIESVLINKDDLIEQNQVLIKLK